MPKVDQIVKEYLHLNRKRRHLQRRIEKDQAEIVKLEARINELKPYFEEKNKFINYGVAAGDKIVINLNNAEDFREILGNSITDLIKGKT